MCREYWRVPLMGAWGILRKLNFFSPSFFFGWLNIAAVEEKSNNALGAQGLFPDPSGSGLHQSELRTEAQPGCSLSFRCCHPKRGGHLSAEVACDKAPGFFYLKKKSPGTRKRTPA